ncbi:MULTISPECIES: AAA family ATPase [unclassified Neorhizobium]|uniref:dTMP kinase n=1 Tax=unclassified Neorhizobium TaxID=2629175 RepID=UPI001FF22DDB|nr:MULTISPECIES: AAA family ATPase [unclassified Neorhizobium]MCJ9673277.1 AAA family ATPase [Neorhizobium sp. SHOUNA12B]MCJ9748665.1 AAA family ATPase [Neorhizobium sp. SHOUNA12A]
MNIANSDSSTPQPMAPVSLMKHGLPGHLIAICGADGTGKSTAVKLLVQALNEKTIGGPGLLLLRQPSDWWRSDPHVKSTILFEGDAEIADELALGVFAVADRLNQQVRVIEPALAAGHTILMDRYVYCLLTYYMAKSDAQFNYLAPMCRPLFEPDITFVFECPPQVAIDRVVRRDGVRAARYDQQIGPMTRIMNAYRSVAHDNGLHLLSSLDPPETILAKLLEVLREHGIGGIVRGNDT